MRKRIERVEDFRDRIATAYRRAMSEYWADEQLRDHAIIRIVKHPDYARLTIAQREYLRGYRDALQIAVWRSVEWRLGPASGPTRIALSPWTDEMSALSRQPGELYGGHYWIGTDRVYTAYAPINATRETAQQVTV
jgi:hypothetical protein